MERESFEDDEVARLLNREFVAIKVDREERPDIDSIYMSVCQALNGNGGWPLTIIMTPDGKPFFAGTYFPKHDRSGLPGLLTVLKKTAEIWRKDRDEILKTSENIMAAISEQQESTQLNNSRHANHKEFIEAAFEQYSGTFDSVYGGFGRAPKFPSPHILLFLLRYWKLTGDETALKMVEITLISMRKGGIFDHIGYGFCRYSTDRAWLVPHFEKMLYDNALLAIAYLETYQATGNVFFAKTANEIFTYVLRDMTSREGGFFSAEDADSENGEGKSVEGQFYTWTPDEIKQALGGGIDAERFMAFFDITPGGNFEGRSIPNTIKTSIPDNDLDFAEQCRMKLYNYREKRKRPFKDDKILASWNGLMIAAMALGGRVLGNASYTSAAKKAAHFIWERMVSENGRLLAVYRNGSAPVKAFADDYTSVIWGLLELYETTYKPEYLRIAIKLNNDLLDLFWDRKNGGLFLYGNDSEQLITRPKEGYDGAIPSANSTAANNFIRLARLTGAYELEEKALQIIRAFSGNIEDYPAGFGHMLNAAILIEAKGCEVIISGSTDEGAGKLINVLRQGYRPFTISVHYHNGAKDLKDIIPYLKDYSPINGKAAAYVCRNFACNQPVTDAASLSNMLQ